MIEDSNKNSKDYINEIEFKKTLNINNNEEKINNQSIKIAKKNKTKNNCLLIILVLITSAIIFIYLFFIKIYNKNRKDEITFIMDYFYLKMIKQNA